MKLDMNLVLEQKQELVLTPALKLSLDILQDNSLELKERIEKELLENPILEVREGSGLSRNFSSYAPWDRLEDKLSLKEHLIDQLSYLELEDREDRLLRRLVEYVNRQGYLVEEFIKDVYFHNYNKEELDKAIWYLQHLSPAGVGARNLSECLILQLRNQGHDTSIALDIVTDDLEDVAAHRLDKLAKKYDSTMEEIEEAIRLIQSLDPKPGLAFHKDDGPHGQIADIRVEKIDDILSFDLNEGVYPDVYLSPYYSSLSLDELDDRSRIYISDKTKRANLLLEALAQRRRTISGVMELILEIQREFFFHGDKGMAPLNLLDISEKMGCHESTISRAINGKFLLFENQLYSLSYFFPSALEGADGRLVSSLYVKSLIEDLVLDEDKSSPLSDEALSREVAKKGIKVARRTVAKYREEIGILSSVFRKNF